MPKMGRPGGNPEFGTKYKMPKKEEQVFDAQISARLHKDTRNKISDIAKSRGMSIPDLVREIVYEYLEQYDKMTA